MSFSLIHQWGVTMKQYTYMELQAIGQKYYKDTNFCSVVAVSVAANVGFGKAYHMLRREGRKHGKGVQKFMIDAAMDKLGFKLFMMLQGYEGKQARTIARELPQQGTFIVYFRGHAAAVRNGQMVDWTEKRAHRVLAVYRVFPKEI